MKTTLMTKMIVFGFALTISFMLGLSNAVAVIEPPCFNLLECRCDDAPTCGDPVACTFTVENCGDQPFTVAYSIFMGVSGPFNVSTYVEPATIATTPVYFYLPPEDYDYSVTVTATDDYGNTTTQDGCAGTVSVPPCLVEVPVDIKPMSCPNPLNVKDRGVLSVAILGTSIVDVTQIDPASIELAGVSPLRWSWEDVATPAEDGCNEYEGDGYLDLVLKFDTQEVIANLGEVEDGQEIPLSLTGNLMEEYGSAPIMGEDVVVIVKKGN